MADTASVHSHATTNSGWSSVSGGSTATSVVEALAVEAIGGTKKETWKKIYWRKWLRPLLVEIFTAVNREPDNNVVSAAILVIEFIQTLAFSFEGVQWGVYGGTFSHFLTVFQLSPYVSSPNFFGQGIDTSAALLIAAFLVVVVLFADLAAAVYTYSTRKFIFGTVPIRVLKWGGRILQHVLYVPILFIFLNCALYLVAVIMFSTVVNIDLSIEAASYILLLVIVVLLVLLVPFTLLCGITSLSPDPRPNWMFQRVGSTVDTIKTISKTIMIILQLSLESQPAMKNGFVIANAFCIAFYVFHFMPYYSKAMNCIQVTMGITYIITSLFSIAMFVKFGLNGSVASQPSGISPPDVGFFVWIAIAVLSATGSYFAIDRYFERRVQLLRRTLQKTPSRKQLSEATDEQFNGPLFSHTFPNHSSVEIATRFIHHIGRPDEESLCIVRDIYIRGLRQFNDGSPAMLATASMFFGTYLSDHQVWKLYLDKAQGTSPSLDVSILIAQSDAERKRYAIIQRSISGTEEVDEHQQIERKRLIKRCKKLTSEIVDMRVLLWKSLMLHKLDRDSLQDMTIKIGKKEQKCEYDFNLLIQMYPDDNEVLTYYADFMERVQRQFDEVDELCAYLRHSAQTEADGSQSALGLSLNHDRMLKEEKNQASKKKTRKFRSPKRTVNKKEMRAMLKLRSEVLSIKSNAIQALSIITISVTILLMGVAVGQLIWFRSTMDSVSASINSISMSSIRRLTSSLIPLRILQMADAARNNDLVTLQLYQQSNEDAFTTFFGVQETLFFSSDQTKPSYKYWLTPWIPLKFYLPGNVTQRYWYNPLSTWDASSEFWRKGREANGINPEIYRNSSYLINPAWRYVMENYPLIYTDSYDMLTKLITTENAASISAGVITEFVALGIMAGILLLIGIFVFRPAMNASFQNTNTAVKAVLALPKANVEECYSHSLAIQRAKLHRIKATKKDASQKAKDPSSGNSKDNLKDEPEASKENLKTDADQANTNENESDGGESDDDDDDDDDVISDSLTKDDIISESHQSRYRRLTMLYSSSLFAILVAFAIYASVTALGSNQVLEAGQRMNLGMEIQYVGWRIAFEVKELMAFDGVAFLTTSDVKGNLSSDLGTFNGIQFALLFGDLQYGLSPGPLPEVLAQVMFTQHYNISSPNGGWQTASVDEMVNIAMNELQKLLTTNTILPTNPSALRVMELMPWIVSGFNNQTVTTTGIFYNNVQTYSRISIAVFVLILVFLAANYLFVFRRLQRITQEGHENCQRLLLLVPHNNANFNKPFQILLKGKAGAEEHFKDLEKELEINAELGAYSDMSEQSKSLTGSQHGSSLMGDACNPDPDTAAESDAPKSLRFSVVRDTARDA